MNYSEIVDPSNNNKYSIFSKQGKHLLRKYIKTYKLGGSDSSGDATAPAMGPLAEYWFQKLDVNRVEDLETELQ